MAKPIHKQLKKKARGYPLGSQTHLEDPTVLCRITELYGKRNWWVIEYDPETRIATTFLTEHSGKDCRVVGPGEEFVPELERQAGTRFLRTQVDELFEPVPWSCVRRICARWCVYRTYSESEPTTNVLGYSLLDPARP